VGVGEHFVEPLPSLGFRLVLLTVGLLLLLVGLAKELLGQGTIDAVLVVPIDVGA
jgi:hypothetical protein